MFGKDPSGHGDIPDIVKLRPAFKDYLWGGSRLRDIYHKKTDMDPVAESWELSSHHDGESTVDGGAFDGIRFSEFLDIIGDEGTGYKAAARDRFPLLIKFIDAMKPLSIQVHPDDAYALLHANEYGKNEMWHIVDCRPGAYIYYGLKETITPEELKERIENNTILEVLNRVEVKKGDTFFVKAGTIHAIGEGILICEIQQNSNCTYRIYDYDRRDKNGERRPLHIDRAMEVCNLNALPAVIPSGTTIHRKGIGRTLLGSCRYFESTRYDVEDEMTVASDSSSFVSVIILEGTGTIGTDSTSYDFSPADSYFIPAGGRQIKIKGKCSFIATKL
ncbi:MAG: class I mannose-6-phosphate isomerase [Lachnospiraceae bacterium]|nr:class I mannose-6-phosphate isomerase [Lachnospiraceae bacterium]